jgi:hypothetical protein
MHEKLKDIAFWERGGSNYLYANVNRSKKGPSVTWDLTNDGADAVIDQMANDIIELKPKSVQLVANDHETTCAVIMSLTVTTKDNIVREREFGAVASCTTKEFSEKEWDGRRNHIGQMAMTRAKGNVLCDAFGITKTEMAQIAKTLNLTPGKQGARKRPNTETGTTEGIDEEDIPEAPPELEESGDTSELDEMFKL